MTADAEATVLTVNCGSSSLKYALYRAAGGRLARAGGGIIEGLGPGGSGRSYASAVAELPSALGVAWGRGPAVVAHRVVHGGRRAAPTVVDGGVLRELEALTALAPLHNGPAVQALRAALEAVGPGTVHVAVFDTTFHQTIPAHAAAYALPRELAERHGIRRYGFHGLAHQSMVNGYAAATGTDPAAVTAVTVQLGSGASVAAVRAGRSVDTSMGFTPLEGLVMATRSGDLDPSIPGFLARAEGLTPAGVDELLNTRSGLLGLSGASGDVRTLLAAEAAGDQRASFALEVYCYRAAKYIAAYLGLLGRGAALVFGGGVGEHAPTIRARVCQHLAPAGLRLHQRANAAAVGVRARISTAGSRWPCWVVPVDEERILAEQALLAAGH